MTAKPAATYLPPDPQSVKAFAFQACHTLATENEQLANPAIRSDFAAFMTFMSGTLAKYLSKGHADYLLHDYRRPARSARKGGHHAR